MTSRAHGKRTIDRPPWLTESSWPYVIRSIDIGASPIAYTDEGAGPVLVLVHDGMWSFIWGQLIGQLRADFRVITLDFPGSGLSPDTGSPASLAADAATLRQLIEALGVERATLVMHDLGGAVGVGWGRQAPEVVDGMVFVNTFVWPPDSPALRAMLALMGSSAVRAVGSATSVVPRMTSGRFGVGRHLDAEARTAFVGGMSPKPHRRRFHDLMAATRSERRFLEANEQALTDEFRSTPTLTIFGERNDPFGFQKRLLEYFPDAESVVVPKGYHFPMADAPELVARSIASWHTRVVA